MKIAMINDVHLGVRNDSQVFMDAHNRFFKNTFIPTLEAENIKQLIVLGDLFDRRKYINFNVLNNFKRTFFDVLENLEITVHVILGNHDVYYRNTNEVNSPNLLLKEYKNIIVYDSPAAVKFDEQLIGFVPWINLDNEEESFSFIDTFAGDILCGHFEVSGFEMHKNSGRFFGGLKTEFFSKYDHVFSGHFHEPQRSGSVQYLGSPCQFTWSDYDCKRGFHVWDTDKRELTFIPNNDIMFHKIIYNENDIDVSKFDFKKYSSKVVRIVVEEKHDYHKFDLFVDELQNVNPFQLDIIDNTLNEFSDAVDQALIKNEDTMTIVSTYIDDLKLEYDSDKIKNMFRNLYVEALAELD